MILISVRRLIFVARTQQPEVQSISRSGRRQQQHQTCVHCCRPADMDRRRRRRTHHDAGAPTTAEAAGTSVARSVPWLHSCAAALLSLGVGACEGVLFWMWRPFTCCPCRLQYCGNSKQENAPQIAIGVVIMVAAATADNFRSLRRGRARASNQNISTTSSQVQSSSELTFWMSLVQVQEEPLVVVGGGNNKLSLSATAAASRSSSGGY